MQKPRTDGSSGLVTIRRQFPEKDQILDDGEVPDEQRVDVERLGERAYLVRVADDGTLPGPQECEVVERLAAQRILNEDAYGRQQRAE